MATLPIQIGIRWGINSALLSILAFIIPYLLGSKFVYSLWYGFAIMGLWLIFLILTARDLRSQQNGFATFSELLKATFITTIILSAISGAFNFIFYQYIDPSFADTLKQYVIESMQEMMHNFDAPAETIEQTISELEAQNFSMSFENMLINIFKSLVYGSIVSILIAAIMQRKAPNNSSL